MSNDRKSARKQAVALADAERRLKQALSLSQALLRSLVAYEAALPHAPSVINSGLPDDEMTERSFESLKRLEITSYLRVESLLALHLACLRAVIEKWKLWGFSDQEVDKLLADPIAADLKGFRDVIFHAGMFDDKHLHRLGSNAGLVKWSTSVVSALRAALIDWHDHATERMNSYAATRQSHDSNR